MFDHPAIAPPASQTSIQVFEIPHKPVGTFRDRILALVLPTTLDRPLGMENSRKRKRNWLQASSPKYLPLIFITINTNGEEINSVDISLCFSKKGTRMEIYRTLSKFIPLERCIMYTPWYLIISCLIHYPLYHLKSLYLSFIGLLRRLKWSLFGSENSNIFSLDYLRILMAGYRPTPKSRLNAKEVVLGAFSQ